MTARNLAALLLRLWGLLSIIEIGVSSPNLLVSLAASSTPQQEHFMRAAFWTQSVSVALGLIAGIVVLVAGSSIARWIVPDDQPLATSMTARQLFLVLIAILGFYFIVNGVQDAARLGALVAGKGYDETPMLQYLQMHNADALSGAVFNAIAGVALILGRHKLADYAS